MSGIQIRLAPEVLKVVDMDLEMKDNILRKVEEALNEALQDKEIAIRLKSALEADYKGSVWHVIVGRNFGSCVTYEAKHYIYFYVGQKGFLVFKTVF